MSTGQVVLYDVLCYNWPCITYAKAARQMHEHANTMTKFLCSLGEGGGRRGRDAREEEGGVGKERKGGRMVL